MATVPEKSRIEEHLRALVGERNLFTAPDNLKRAEDYVARQFSALGLQVERDPVALDGHTSNNVFGLQPGTAREPDLFILGAHYDTVVGSPGADDNASAVAALLEIAHCLKDVSLSHSLLFAGFALEEYGMLGSAQYAFRAKNNSHPVTGMISLEMLGYRSHEPGSQSYPAFIDPTQYPDRGDFIAVVGVEASRQLTSDLSAAMSGSVPALPVIDLVLPGNAEQFPDVRRSDHAPFWDLGYSAVMVTDTANFRNPNYHQATDVLETLDLDFIRDVAQGVASYLESELC